MREAWFDGSAVKKCVTSKNVPVGQVLKTWHFLCRLCSYLEMCFFSVPLLALCMPISVSLHYLNRRGTTTAPKYCANRMKEVPGGTVYQPRQTPFLHTESSWGSPSPFHTASYPNFSPVTIRSEFA